MSIDHQAQEGCRINGIGVNVHHDTFRRQTVIVVEDEEMGTNPLVRSWVEALERSAETATRELVLRKGGQK